MVHGFGDPSFLRLPFLREIGGYIYSLTHFRTIQTQFAAAHWVPLPLSFYNSYRYVLMYIFSIVASVRYYLVIQSATAHWALALEVLNLATRSIEPEPARTRMKGGMWRPGCWPIGHPCHEHGAWHTVPTITQLCKEASLCWSTMMRNLPNPAHLHWTCKI